MEDEEQTARVKKAMEAEKVFQGHLVEFLQKVGGLADGHILTNWTFVTATIEMSGNGYSSIQRYSSRDTPFWQIGGMLDYALTRHHGLINEN